MLQISHQSNEAGKVRFTPVVCEVQDAQAAEFDNDIRDLGKLVLSQIEALQASEGYQPSWHATFGGGGQAEVVVL